jgi:hypothetical protein
MERILMNFLKKLLSAEDLAFFKGLTQDVSAACHYSTATQDVKERHPNQLAFDPVKPGGLKSYPAVWTQDFTMIFAAGFMAPENGLEHLRLILRVQNGPDERRMETGALVPGWAIADHVNFDGSPVFFPGTYSSGPNQGGEYGLRPPYNNYYDAIWLAWMLAGNSKNPVGMLTEDIEGLGLYERLSKAFAVPPADAQGIVYTTEEERAVGFIFCDSVHMTGSLLMPTLLRSRAARHMRDLAMLLGKDADAQIYAAEAQRAAPHLAETFAHESGWLRACTGRSSQPDVFGTLYALYTDALSGSPRLKALQSVLDALDQGQIEQAGALRHVPLNWDFSSETAWEKSLALHNTYQNGGYWFMPAGWLTAILSDCRPAQARAYLQRYLGSMKQEDFRAGTSFAPWEWLFGDERSEPCPVFGPSVTLPYAVLTGRAGC